MSEIAFQSALERLVFSEEYRKAVVEGRCSIENDFQLSSSEMDTMIEVGKCSGWIGATKAVPPCCCCCCVH